MGAGSRGYPRLLALAGRPRQRSKFSEAFVADFMADWREHGPAVLERVRTNNPSTYIRVAAILVPKELNVSVEQKAPGGLDADSYAALRRLLDIIQASGVEGEPQAVFERIEAALRADAATLIEQN